MPNCKRKFLASVVVTLLLAPHARAQSGDWQAVQNLPPRTLISVKTRQNDVCRVEQVTTTDLTGRCYRPFRWTSLTINRAEIREVRLEPSQRKTMWTGAIIGGSVGAVAGGNTGIPASRPIRALAGGAGGAMVGGLVGGIVHIFRRGKVIYKADRTPAKVSQPPAPSKADRIL